MIDDLTQATLELQLKDKTKRLSALDFAVVAECDAAVTQALERQTQLKVELEALVAKVNMFLDEAESTQTRVLELLKSKLEKA